MSEPNNYLMWDDAAVVMLKELYAKGLTHGQIARQLPNRPSRNAVIGKANRLIAAGAMTYRGANEVAARRATKASGVRARPPKQVKDPPRPPKAPMPKAEAPGATARPWLTRLEGECRAPIGEPNADMLMCCARAGHGTNGDYCGAHAARLFKPARDVA